MPSSNRSQSNQRSSVCGLETSVPDWILEHPESGDWRSTTGFDKRPIAERSLLRRSTLTVTLRPTRHRGVLFLDLNCLIL